MARRCQMSIPRETWVYLTILAIVIVGAILREINLLIILAGLLFGPLWISWHLIRATLRKLRVTRRLPRTVFPGELFDVELRVRNTRRRLDSWALVVEDRVRHVDSQHRSTAKSAHVLIPHVAAQDECVVSYRCRLWDRGRYQLGPAKISTQIPVGLLRGAVKFRRTDEILVYPRLGKLTARWSELVKVDRLGQRSWRRNQGPIEGDFYGLRDWRCGDSRRWIHWRSSAKRNQLVVRQFEQFRAQDFVILLDLWPSSDERGSAKTHEAIERAISFVATVVAENCHRANGHISIGVAGETVRLIKGPAGMALLNETLEVLADAKIPENDRFRDLMVEIPSFGSEDQIVIVTTHPTNPISSGRGPVFRQEESQRRHRLQQSLSIDVTDTDFENIFASEHAEEVM